ncbi:ubiquitin-like domain-containing protein [Nonomuraea sp. NPDC050556]|uniref:resuscitation-promoting factor n=1 Tax=Nonomuraea sp. NPDC050556 TaxID=3364369 RepID=UPI0037AE7981
MALTAIALVTAANLGKQVQLIVDGRSVAMRTFADNVYDLLDQADVSVGFGDTLYPSGQDDVVDGAQIIVRHGRPVTVTVDGRSITRMVTATDVAGALAEMAINHAGGRLSVPPEGALPASGLSVFTARRVYVVRGSVRRETVTTGATVGEVLKQEGVRLRRGDRVSPALSAFPKDGTVIRVVTAMPQHAIPIQAAVAKLNWAALAACESHGNPRAVNAGGPYYGLYQFNLAMWQAVGGTRTPNVWPAAEQTYRAQLLYQRVGGRWQGQWPHCGARLFS